MPATASDNALTVYCENTDWIAKVYTDESAIYGGSDNCSSGDYWLGRHVRDIDLHKSGIERIWAILEPGHTGVYHWWGAYYFKRYVSEFTGRCNGHGHDTLDRVGAVFDRMRGKRCT